MSISRILQLAGLTRIDESEKTEFSPKEKFGFLRSFLIKEDDNKKAQEAKKKKIKESDAWLEAASHYGWKDNCEKIARLFNTTPQAVWDVKNSMHNWPDGHIPHNTIGKAIAEYIYNHPELNPDDEPGEDDIYHNGFWIDSPPEKDLGFH